MNDFGKEGGEVMLKDFECVWCKMKDINEERRKLNLESPVGSGLYKVERSEYTGVLQTQR